MLLLAKTKMFCKRNGILKQERLIVYGMAKRCIAHLLQGGCMTKDFRNGTWEIEAL